MSHIAIDLPATRVASSAATRIRPAQRTFATALGLCLAVGLTVPSSEIRAKAFRLGVIAKSVKTRAAS